MRSRQKIVFMARGSLDQYSIPDLYCGTGIPARADSNWYYFSTDKIYPDTGPGVHMRS